MDKVYIIAEAGVNHNGSESLAMELVTLAKSVGADAIKFQLFNAATLVTKNAEQAAYQTVNVGKQTQYDMLKALELSFEGFKKLHDFALKQEIDFIVTPFDLQSLDFLTQDLGLSVIKIGSGDVTNGPLLLKAAQAQKKIILSTGMSTLSDVEQALKVIAFGYLNNGVPSRRLLECNFASIDAQTMLQEKVTLLHCTSEYPASVEDVNLRAMDTMKVAFNLPVGYSDHTKGIEIALAAVARGAIVIEKHFTPSKSLSGPDHRASLDPEEFKAMVQGIRKIERSFGHGHKYPTQSEFKNANVVRRSLVANTRILKGDVFTPENIGIKRPLLGESPMSYWDLLGKQSQKDYVEDELII